MGTQNNFHVDAVSSNGAELVARPTETVNYITDLLGELQVIAEMSGMSELSEDLVNVLSKHLAGSFKAT